MVLPFWRRSTQRSCPASIIETFDCGSRSITSTRTPSDESVSARLATVVDLPTPPFMLTTETVRGATGYSTAASLEDRSPSRRPVRGSGQGKVGASDCGLRIGTRGRLLAFGLCGLFGVRRRLLLGIGRGHEDQAHVFL